MALETIDAAVEACDLKPNNNSQTDGLLLEGAHEWTPTTYIKIVQDQGKVLFQVATISILGIVNIILGLKVIRTMPYDIIIHNDK